VSSNKLNLEDNNSNIEYIFSELSAVSSININGVDIESTIEDILQDQFMSIIEKGLDGTYTFNIVRDSLTQFPNFYSAPDMDIYGPVNMPREIQLFTPIQIVLNRSKYIHDALGWEKNYNNVIKDDFTSLNCLETPHVIMHDSNIFQKETYFNDFVSFSNNVTFGSNLFIHGMIESFGDHVTINDSLYVNDALHVGEYIQTNALKADYVLGNYFRCNSNIAFSNDWYITTRMNPNNTNLKDLVFKGKHENETIFTDFIPGQLNFTGQHRCSYENQEFFEHMNLQGYIVSSTGVYSDLNDDPKMNIDDAIPIIRVTTKSYDSTVFGVISDFEDKRYLIQDDSKRAFQIGTMRFTTDNNKKTRKLIINSVGEGGIWVCGQNGNIENGDLIVSSNSHGHGMKQNDNIIRNYTVAKATCDAIFKNVKDKKFIGCIYKF
jgi:hypothetical protein